MRRIFGEVFQLLQRSMDAATLRQKAISQNIANVNTPDYERVEVSFEGELKRVLAERKEIKLQGMLTNPMHIPIGPPSMDSVKPVVWRDTTGYYRYDKNNVDIDKELVKLAENSIKYRAMSSLMGKKFAMLKSVISSRR